jgi:hypothetical protein
MRGRPDGRKMLLQVDELATREVVGTLRRASERSGCSCCLAGTAYGLGPCLNQPKDLDADDAVSVLVDLM